jgi:tetratricopeptide (TPR) repeat protein
MDGTSTGTDGTYHHRDGLRSSREAQEQGQQIVEDGIAKLSQKIDHLQDALEKRDHNLKHSAFRFREDTIKRSGEECLKSAGSVRKAYTSSYRPTPTSIAGRHPAPGDIPAWERNVTPQAPPESICSKELDGSITNETQSLSHSDSGYNSDQISRFHSAPDHREGFSANFLTDLINRFANEAQRFCETNQYDRAAEAQEKAIKSGCEREQNHGIEFKEERHMRHTLAKIQLERRMYKPAEEILLRLLDGVEQDSADAWAWEHELANVYFAQGMYESAARYANRANNGRQNSLEMGDNKIIETLTLLSKIYDKMGNRTEAALLSLEALKHRIRQEGPSDEMMLETLQQEQKEQVVHEIIDALEDGEAKDILALKAFQWATALNQQSIVFSLWNRYQIVETNVDTPNDFGMTPLISSVAFGHEEMTRFLLGKGADANARASNDSSRDTALMLAADKQSTSIVKQLLERGANVRDYNKHGRNALHRAQGRPLDNEDAIRKEVVTMILEKDRESLINAQCAAGKTPLHLASEYGNTPIMAFLLAQGANIEARDFGKRTSLILAIESGWPKAVKLLLERGAEQDIEDLMGRTPHMIARSNVSGSREIQALLKAKKNPGMRRKPSVITESPLSPQHSRISSIGILSPIPSLPPAFPTPRSQGRSEFMPLTLQLPFSKPSTTSMISSSTRKRGSWSIYSHLNKVGRDPD